MAFNKIPGLIESAVLNINSVLSDLSLTYRLMVKSPEVLMGHKFRSLSVGLESVCQYTSKPITCCMFIGAA